MYDEEVELFFKLEDLIFYEFFCFKLKLFKMLLNGKIKINNKYGILYVVMYEDYEDKNRIIIFFLLLRNV